MTTYEQSAIIGFHLQGASVGEITEAMWWLTGWEIKRVIEEYKREKIKICQ